MAAAQGVLFHVKHAEVTPFLSRDNPRIQEKIDSVTAGFQGGTKIASSLKTICFGGDVTSVSERKFGYFQTAMTQMTPMNCWMY